MGTFPNPPLITGDPPTDGQVAVYDAASGTWVAGSGGDPLPSGGTTGQALVKESDTDGDVGWNGPYASAAGTHITHKFSFTHATAGLATGAVAVFTDGYTPAEGDLLIDAWIEIGTAWDGTTPLGDFGPFVGSALGMFGNQGFGPIDMTLEDGTYAGWAVLSQNFGATTVSGLYQAVLSGGNPGLNGYRSLPGKFASADPLKVCVSTTGRTTGDDPGATTGAGVLYVTTCTP